ncbi:DNA polymerase III subunit epsilon [Psychromonas sp. psych-6C06]|uniref:exonuclease domain-containing protein n=1 Tax=Psychromonas sp. psych-6C06 TaxID=2058089 RepID=UPI000C334EE0|nr:exonuclease domain-containing protein [Psychromonas sp. psych-6C06]PKF63053.1 DNA polymerase III subunit epsilon [Psychromonas sp. psych-6C06]
MLRNWFIKAYLHYKTRACEDAQIRTYHKALLPLLNLNLKTAPLLALDLEMTGINPKVDQIISIGLIPIINGQITLNQGKHKLIKIEGSVGQSATIHGLVDADLKQAITIEEAMKWLLKEITGYVLVAHHAPLDMRFIEQALLKQSEPSNKKKCRLYAIDTLHIEHRRLLRKQTTIKEGELRLANCRSRYNLPNYDAHNALVDALSCAELLMAQTNRMGGAETIKVSELIR